MNKRYLIALLFVLFTASNALAGLATVSFGHGDFYEPEDYLEKISADKNHPAHANVAKLARAFDAVVYIGRHATGVLISPDGLMITARHAIVDLYLGPVDDCSRLPLFLDHENGKKTRRVYCDKILVEELTDDFALIKLEPRDEPYPYVEVERDENAIQEDSLAIVAGHPHAADFEKSMKKISQGPVVLYRPHDQELPHFLHLIDTEGGHSGAPVLSPSGKLIGMHFRGVPQFSEGVEVTVGGEKKRIRSFNVAIPLPYLAAKYLK